MRRCKKHITKPTQLLALILLSITLCSPAYAHPHVFVDYRITFVFNPAGLRGVALHWTFDEMFSQSLVDEGDLDHDLHFDNRETAEIKKGAFDNLANHDYFTYIRINDRPFPVTDATDFHVVLEDGRISYTFFIPCPMPIGKDWQKIAMTFYDPTIYADLALAQEGVAYQGEDKTFALRHEITLAQEAGFTDAPLMPDGIVMEFRRR